MPRFVSCEARLGAARMGSRPAFHLAADVPWPTSQYAGANYKDEAKFLQKLTVERRFGASSRMLRPASLAGLTMFHVKRKVAPQGSFRADITDAVGA
jgi:hypothetical protein